jgi:hypothetical protein
MNRRGRVAVVQPVSRATGFSVFGSMDEVHHLPGRDKVMMKTGDAAAQFPESLVKLTRGIPQQGAVVFGDTGVRMQLDENPGSTVFHPWAELQPEAGTLDGGWIVASEVAIFQPGQQAPFATVPVET